MGLAHSRQPRAVRRPAGVLWPAQGADVYRADRAAVTGPAALVVDHYWSVVWRCERVTPYRAQVLGDPVAHLTVEDAEGAMHGHPMPSALVHGVVTEVFTVDLPVAGRVAGLAFRPGGLAALLETGIGDLTGRVVGASDLFGADVREVRDAVLAEPAEQVRQRILVDYVADRLLPRAQRVAEDRDYATVRTAVELMRAREQVTLAPVAAAVNVSPRTLQRLFRRYVGVSPTWVLRRYRLQDAARAIDSGQGEDLAALAASLGFADQAHFTRAFTTVIGVPPSRYRTGRAP
ncbi:helix-turn-helix domain-containing protein [Georgenia alba]|uniref:Helix-turn-helix domain-containing protein n=1 Tax=Georgenia alba TaxID=2233858 RepID=A0ABW2QAG9_9MICO